MRRSLILLPTLLLSMACGDAGQAILEPVSVASPNPANAIVSVDGAQYEIGCPDYPCPVSPLVLQHIADKRYFWLPPGTFTWPAIYLYILKVPVQLRPVTQPTVVRTPTAPPPEPDLIGPGELIGEPSGANALVVCSNVPLSLNIPDAGTWDFVSGDIEYEYVTWNAASASWVSTGQVDEVPFGNVAWSEMLAGTFQLMPPKGNMDYNATFVVRLQRGTYKVTVSHTLLCARQSVTLAEPPAPSLTGPTDYRGTRDNPERSLVCTAIGVTLISPDGGPWDFVAGSRTLEFVAYDPLARSFILSGVTQTDALSPSDWQSLLAGTYVVDLQARTAPFYMTFTVTVERGSYQHTISHRAVCGGPDFSGTV